jgi:hypothetical protein
MGLSFNPSYGGIMKIEDAKDIAAAITALCVHDTWNKEICDPYSKSEEMRRYKGAI